MARHARYVVRTVRDLLYWLSQTDPTAPVMLADGTAVVLDLECDEALRRVKQVTITDEE